MGFSLKKLTKSVSKAINSVADVFTYGGFSKLTKSDSYMNDLSKSIFGKDYGDTMLGAVTSALKAKGGDLSGLLGSLNSNNTSFLTNLLGTSGLLGESVFSAKQAKEQAKYNSELNYKYQTKLNEQGYAHDKEMLGIQQAYDREMANTAVQRQMADLNAAGINPAMASQLGGAGGGGLGGGSSLGGGSAQTDKANWLAYNLEKMAAQRDAQRVAIEQANSAKSAEVADKQMEQMNTDMAKTIAEIPWIGKTNQANIKYTLAQAGKAHSETALAQANADKIKQGRWSELGAPIADQIVNALADKGENYTDDGKKKHWYGIRKDGR